MAEFRASHRYAPISARKARLVADMIRGLPVNQALAVLDRAPQRGAAFLRKVVRSAVANAEQMAEIDPNHLHVEKTWVDEGPVRGGVTRWRPGARGRAMPYRRPTAHLHVTLATDTPVAAAAPAAATATEGATESEES